MYESKTKIIPAKKLEELRNESREFEVDVVFEDDEPEEGTAAPAVESLDPWATTAEAEGVEAVAPPTDGGDGADEETLDDGRQQLFAHARRAPVPTTEPEGEPGPHGEDPTLDAELSSGAAMWTAPPSTEPSPPSGAPISQSSPDARATPMPTAPPASTGSRSRPASSPHFPSGPPVAPISPIGPATIPRPGPPRPSSLPKKT